MRLATVLAALLLIGVMAQDRTVVLPPERPSAQTPFPHRTRTWYPHDGDAVPVPIARALREGANLASAQGQRWRLEPEALVREHPTPLRLGIRDGLPLGALRALAIGSDGAIWAGGEEGLVRFTGARHAWERWHTFIGRRYLPSNDVVALAAGESGAMWVKTTAGIAHLRYEALSLDDKARRFDQRLQARHTRHGLVGDTHLRVTGDLTTSHQYPADNDGLWTAVYAASQAYRYAVTKENAALAAARRALAAMVRLETITGHPGFPARSFRHRSEPRHPDGEWHWTQDGEWEWKGDTSSDELVGHFYAYALAHELLPEDPLTHEIRAVVTRIADHLIRNKYYLVDLDGEPTRWGRWGLDYFQTAEGREEQALRATELLSHMLVAAEVTGERRFRDEYWRLVREHRFHERMQTYREHRRELNYSDEELALLSFYPLFRYEKDPELLGAYRRALSQWWANIQLEDNPLWIYIYARANPGAPAPLDRAAHAMFRIPLDLVTWSIQNARRRDVPLAAERDRRGKLQTTRLLPPDERRVQRWNANPFELDGGDGGHGEDDGAAYLLPYWMGRYYGFIASTGKRPLLRAPGPQ